MKREIRVLLDEDTVQFLEMARGERANASVSDFINSLLRQERFRQGFPAYFKKPERLKSGSPWRERLMLLCSGLLPLSTRPQR